MCVSSGLPSSPVHGFPCSLIRKPASANPLQPWSSLCSGTLACAEDKMERTPCPGLIPPCMGGEKGGGVGGGG